jgi:hypothetical protein
MSSVILASIEPTLPEPFSPTFMHSLQAAISFLNDYFFDPTLPDIFLTTHKKARSKGHFAAHVYAGRHGREVPEYEININLDQVVGESDADAVSTLLHELCHLWRHLNGPQQKRPYHDKLWSAKMNSVGLVPSSTGKPGGRETGAKMSHYILPGGVFEQAFAELQATGWTLDIESAPRRNPSRGPSSKSKFTCPACGQNIWGKPDTEVACLKCAPPIPMPCVR